MLFVGGGYLLQNTSMPLALDSTFPAIVRVFFVLA
jgi:hypothetical protein